MGDILSPARPAGDDPWVGPTGIVASPDAPAGGGGFGSFRSPALLGSDGSALDAFPHPQSPAARLLDPADLQNKAEELEQTAPKPPPLIAKDQTKTVNGISVTIKADQTSATGVKEGEGDTSMQVDPGTTPPIITDTPDPNAPNAKVAKIDGPLPVITATIQTRYKSSSSPTGTSAYGRGTTQQDKKDGNTTLGFHESCHRQDYLDFVKNNKLPTFTGKAGMTVADWNKAVAAYNQAVFDYQDKAAAASEQATDEVGDPTKTQFNAKNP